MGQKGRNQKERAQEEHQGYYGRDMSLVPQMDSCDFAECIIMD